MFNTVPNPVRKLTAIFFVLCFVLIARPNSLALAYDIGGKEQSPSRHSKVADSFRIYESLRKKILSHNADIGDMETFGRVVYDTNNLQKIIEILSIPKDSRDDKYYERLYSHFIQARPNADVLYDYLKIELWNVLEKADKNDKLRASIYAWSWAYGAQAAVLAYTATHDERFLGLIVSTYDTILKFRDSQRNKTDVVRGRILRSWGIGRPPKGVMNDSKVWWSNIVTHTGRITYPVSMFCKVVFDDKRLHKRYLQKAQYYLRSVEDAVREFDNDFKVIPNTGEGYYRSPVSGRVEPLNHAHSIGNTFVMLCSITGNKEYRTKAENLARYFLSSVKTEKNGSYVWGYDPSPENRKNLTPEFIWKGQITISFPVLAYENNIVFNDRDITALTKTFLGNIYRGSCAFNSRISSEMKPLSLSEKKNEHEGITGWILLSHYNPEIRRIIESTVAGCPDIFTNGWFDNMKMALA